MKRNVLLAILLGMQVAYGQQPNDDHQLILQLMNRVQELEAEVSRLKGTTPSVVQGPAPAAAALPPSEAMGGMAGMGGVLRDTATPLQAMQFKGFSDIQYQASDQPGDHHSFALGQFDLFITNKLSDKFSVLGELVVEAETDNAIGIDLERLLFQYTANDYFNVSAGRYHTAIGYYNTAYHHSAWMQSSVDRPFLFAFEDNGGILPVHNVGLSVTGRIPSGGLGMHYIAEIGNGRTSRSALDEAVQNRVDENNGKSVNFGVYFRPDKIRDLQAGFSVYHDTLHPQGLASRGQTILAAHAVYQSSSFEFMNEAVLIRHTPERGRTMNIPAFYSQISKPFGKFRPYFRYEYVNVPRREAVFQDIGLRHGPVTGIRYDFSEFAAYKLEYFRLFLRGEDVNGLRTQVSFTF